MTAAPRDPARSGPGANAATPGDSPNALSGFNWGAFLLAPVWGVAHGQWPAALFLPAWVFVDNMIRRGGAVTRVAVVAGWAMFAVTLGLQAAFARNADRVGYARVAGRMPVAAYVRRQRWWSVAGAAYVVAMAVWVAVFLAR